MRVPSHAVRSLSRDASVSVPSRRAKVGRVHISVLAKPTESSQLAMWTYPRLDGLKDRGDNKRHAVACDAAWLDEQSPAGNRRRMVRRRSARTHQGWTQRARTYRAWTPTSSTALCISDRSSAAPSSSPATAACSFAPARSASSPFPSATSMPHPHNAFRRASSRSRDRGHYPRQLLTRKHRCSGVRLVLVRISRPDGGGGVVPAGDSCPSRSRLSTSASLRPSCVAMTSRFPLSR
jgi:hypothetical protein